MASGNEASAYDITYYGTGLALATFYLEDGTRIDLRRDPSSFIWTASVKKQVFLPRSLDVVKRFWASSARFDGGLFKIDAKDPDEAAKLMTKILDGSDGWRVKP